VALGTPVPVLPVVALVGALLWEQAAPRGIIVCTATELVSTLRRLPAVWNRADVAAAFAVARRPATWTAVG
jgi:hypothetical protein